MMMDGTLEAPAPAAEAAVKDWSGEFRGLDEESRARIQKHLEQVPVRLGDVARELGVRVLLSTLPRGISGQIGREGDGYVIRVNRHETRHRQRFTLAHELAHFLLHREVIDRMQSLREDVILRSGQPESIEFEANRLASDLVIPPDQLQAELRKYPGPLTEDVISDLAKRFQVSTTAMEIKLGVM